MSRWSEKSPSPFGSSALSRAGITMSVEPSQPNTFSGYRRARRHAGADPHAVEPGAGQPAVGPGEGVAVPRHAVAGGRAGDVRAVLLAVDRVGVRDGGVDGRIVGVSVVGVADEVEATDDLRAAGRGKRVTPVGVGLVGDRGVVRLGGAAPTEV